MRFIARVLSVMAAAACLVWHLPAAARPKADTVFLQNGDRITGEIVELKYGQLRVKTDSLGTVLIEWLDVARIESPYDFVVESTSGARRVGKLAPGSAPGRLQVAGSSELAVSEIASIGEIEADFFDRLTGNVSFGFDQTKATDVRSLAFGLNAEYRSEKQIASLDASFNSSHTSDAGTRNQSAVTLRNEWLRPGDYFWLGLLSHETNDAQGIDGRLLAGAARGRYLLRRADMELATFIGAGVTKEWAAGNGEDSESVEGLLGLRWNVFRFRDPETSVLARLLLLPGISDSGRYRGNAAITLRHEVVRDLFFDLTFQGSYDNEPPSIDAEKTDYTVSTSLGYKF